MTVLTKSKKLSQNAEFKKEAWELEISWINTGKVEGVDEELIRKQLLAYEKYNKVEIIYRIKLHSDKITPSFFVKLQRMAKQLGTLASERINSGDSDGCVNMDFDFFIKSNEEDTNVIAQQMYEEFNTQAILHKASIILEVLKAG